MLLLDLSLSHPQAQSNAKVEIPTLLWDLIPLFLSFLKVKRQ